MKLNAFSRRAWPALALFVLAGCESSGNAAGSTPAGIEIVGTWTSAFGEEKIANDSWTANGFTSKIAASDNVKNVAYTQNPADAKFSPSAFNKIVWTEPKSDSFYYCTVDFGLASLDLAKATTKTADDKDLDGKGCGGFGWTKLTRKK